MDFTKVNKSSYSVTSTYYQGPPRDNSASPPADPQGKATPQQPAQQGQYVNQTQAPTYDNLNVSVSQNLGAAYGFDFQDLAHPQAAAGEPYQYVVKPGNANQIQGSFGQPTITNADFYAAPPTITLNGFPGTVNYVLPNFWQPGYGTGQVSYAVPNYSLPPQSPASPVPAPSAPAAPPPVQPTISQQLMEQYQQLYDLRVKAQEARDNIYDKRDQIGDLKVNRMNTPYEDLGKVQGKIDGLIDGMISDRKDLLGLTFQEMDTEVKVWSLQQEREEEKEKDEESQ